MILSSARKLERQSQREIVCPFIDSVLIFISLNSQRVPPHKQFLTKSIDEQVFQVLKLFQLIVFYISVFQARK